MNCGVPKIDVFLFQGRESIVAHAIEQEFFACLLRAKVVGIRRLFFLVACNNLLALCRAYIGTECRGCVCPRISQSCIAPRRIVDDDAVLCLGNNRGKEAVPLSFVEMGGLQDCECPAKLVFEGVSRFGSDDACNLCDDVLLGDEHVVCSIF